MTDPDPLTALSAFFLVLMARNAEIEDRLSRVVDPSWDVGPEVVAVTNADRHAPPNPPPPPGLPLTMWIDGIVGYAELGGSVQGFAANGPESARWTTDPEGDYLDEVHANEVEIDTSGGIDPDVGYAAGGPIYHDEVNGRLIKVYHAERYPHPDPALGFWSFLGLAVADEATPDLWADMGAIITPERPFVPDEDSQAEITGGPFLITDDDQMLVYFKDTDENGIWKGLCVARCPLATVLAAAADPDPTEPPVFTKRYLDAWDEPEADGIGGKADDLLPATYFWWFDIVHVVDHDLYVMVTSVPEAEGVSLWLRIGTDPLTWGLQRRLTDVRWADASVCQRTLTIGPHAGAVPQPEEWIEVDDLDLLNGWERAAPGLSPPVRYRRQAGTLYVQMPPVTGGDPDDTIFVLPEGYRPTSYEVTFGWSTLDYSALGFAAVSVNEDGTVRPSYAPGLPVVIVNTAVVRLPES